MSAELQLDYDLLQNEAGALGYRLREYTAMFVAPRERIDLLNAVAAPFFRMLNETLWGDMLMHLGRITDPATMGRFDNLSLAIGGDGGRRVQTRSAGSRRSGRSGSGVRPRRTQQGLRARRSRRGEGPRGLGHHPRQRRPDASSHRSVRGSARCGLALLRLQSRDLLRQPRLGYCRRHVARAAGGAPSAVRREPTAHGRRRRTCC